MKATPFVVGDGHDQIKASDMADLCALAATASPPGKPVLIRAWVSYNDGHAPTLSGATVYLAPTETTARGWRGNYLSCFPVRDYHYPCDELSHWRNAGKWRVSNTTVSGEYIVLAPPDKELPAFTPECFVVCGSAQLNSKLDTQSVIDLVDSARAFRLLQPDGSELPFASLPIKQVSTSTDDGGHNRATVAFRPPPKEDPISASLMQEQKTGWRIVRIQRRVYY